MGTSIHPDIHLQFYKSGSHLQPSFADEGGGSEVPDRLGQMQRLLHNKAGGLWEVILSYHKVFYLASLATAIKWPPTWTGV